jgi:glycosyltransferase involved in cell wall biosynthesis
MISAPQHSAVPEDAAQTVRARRHLYIAWVRFQRRPLSMRDYVGYDLVHIPPATRRWAKPLGYAQQAWRTLAAIRRHRPDVLWFQSPPSLLVYLAALVRLGSRGRIKVVADCHNGALDPRLHGGLWAKLPGVNRLMNGFDAVLAHNAEITEIAARRGIDRARLVTLETRPSPLTPVDTDPDPAAPVVLVPCSFQADEPIDALLDAAARLPDVQFRLTGNRARAEAAGFVARAPANVTFTGFLDGAVYTDLLLHADIVLGLTTVDGIQLSAANEAIGAGRPLVLSETTILRELFGDAAIFADNSGAGLAGAIDEARRHLPDLAARSRTLKQAREARWQGQMAKVFALLR